MASRNTPPRLGRGLAALWVTLPCARMPSPGRVLTRSRSTRSTSIHSSRDPILTRWNWRVLPSRYAYQGVLQPIMVRSHPTVAERFQIVAGERPFRAAMQAGLTDIPAILREMDDSDAAIVALVENLQRQDLNAIEEAEGYQRLLVDFGLTHEALGYAVSKSRSHIGNTIRLLRLPDPVVKDVRSGSLSSGHARALINAPNPEVLAAQVLKRGMSVRQTEALVNKAIAGRGVPVSQLQQSWNLAALEQRVSEALGSRVSITTETRKGGGEISIQFRNLFQLEELIGRLTGQPEHVPEGQQG